MTSEPKAVQPGHNGTSQHPSNTAKAPAKRNRIQLSCSNCRHSKLKCDRQSPCGPCVKRGRASACTFPAPAPRKKAPVSMQNRIRHLEGLVKDVMSGQSPASFSPIQVPSGNSTTAPSRHESDAVVSEAGKDNSGQRAEKSSGQVVLGGKESTYVGATHWAAILTDIEEVKSYFQDEDVTVGEDIKPYTSLIYNAESPTTHLDLLEALPDRLTVDHLVSRWFNSNSPSLHIVHKPTFEKNYRTFWRDPENYSIAFLGFLYSAMLLATISAIITGREITELGEDPKTMIPIFRSSCVQCLVLSDYTKPGPHTMETLLIYNEGLFLLTKDDQIQCYLLMGNAIRLALRMGLHRDSTKVGGNIAPYQAEMRRRLWNQLMQIDLLSSSHTGLPGMTHAIESDALLPRNLLDEDFDESSQELPPSRPETQLTPVSYMICKTRITREAHKIAALANRLTTPSSEEVMELNKLLDEAYDQVPPFFKLDGSGLSITDSLERAIKRYSIATLYQRYRCLLHRKSVLQQDTRLEWSYSKKIGLEAAMELLRIQETTHEAALPGGALAGDRWFLSSFLMHDFLLAAMIVYISIMQLIRSETGNFNDIMFSGDGQRMVKALKKSYHIWEGGPGDPAEARKATAVIRSMLQKIHGTLGQEFPSENGLSENRLTSDNGLDSQQNGLQSMDMNALSLNGQSLPPVASVSGSSSWDLATPFDFDFNTQLEPLDSMTGIQNEFDWDSFDKHFLPFPPLDQTQTWPDVTQELDFNDTSNYL